jgi:para-nitrobenzyl esterase
MVWIHGGGFVGGAGAFYDGTDLAKTGPVIFVSMNYRLGIFGFLADKALGGHSGDYGLEDQQAALQWVKTNISAFGGDPNNVTIFGESAGGSAICDQMASPTAAGLFNKAISQSGEYNSVLGAPTGLQPQDCKATLPTESQAQAAGASFAQGMGCGTATDVAACLRSVPASALLTASGGTLSPIINGSTLTLQLQRAFATGRFNRVPAVMGVLRDENLVGSPTTAADFVADIQAQYGPFASRVLALYPLDRFDNPYIAFRTVAADSDTVCPALRTDRRVSRWATLYGYVIADTDAPLGPLPFYPSRSVSDGSYHAAEHQLLFGNWDTTPLDLNQQALADQMKAEWTAFATSGDPTTTGTPVWPKFRSPDKPVMLLQPAGDSEVQTESELSAAHNCGFWDSVANRGE